VNPLDHFLARVRVSPHEADGEVTKCDRSLRCPSLKK
jgi:hypothetical protein